MVLPLARTQTNAHTHTHTQHTFAKLAQTVKKAHDVWNIICNKFEAELNLQLSMCEE